jgi:hypothetical protein
MWNSDWSWGIISGKGQPRGWKGLKPILTCNFGLEYSACPARWSMVVTSSEPRMRLRISPPRHHNSNETDWVVASAAFGGQSQRMKPSEFLLLKYLTCLRAMYHGVPEPDVLEVYRRTTHLIWSSTSRPILDPRPGMTARNAGSPTGVPNYGDLRRRFTFGARV